MVAISAQKQISKNCVQLTLSTGSVFFIRTTYLSSITEADLIVGSEITDLQLEEIVEAGFVFAAERAALDYLNRSEQCRYLLTAKLCKKGIDIVHINIALDFLEEKKILSDLRFAEAWLRNRVINHAEGRTKLYSELLTRGIKKEIANIALDNFYEFADEEKIFEKALNKCKRLGKDVVATEKYLTQKGFSRALIKSNISNF